jgi:hypothetical protein
VSNETSDAPRLHQRLTSYGVLALAVTVDDADPARLVVYLHGMAGKRNQETALSVIRSMPEVARVRASLQTPDILLVQLISFG